MYKILIAKPNFSKYSTDAMKMLREKGYELIEIDRDMIYTEEELLKICPQIDAVIADSEPWNKRTIAAATKLKVIARYGVGMNSVDTDAAKSRGIVCTNCPGINSDPVAEHAIALMLSAMRKIVQLNETTKAGLWKQEIFKELAGATVGIIGFGAIGSKIAKKLSGFDCNVITYDPYANKELAEKLNTRIVTLDELLSTSDVISLNVPLLESTNHMINRETLARTKRGVIFVSEARGEIVDEEAMYDALVDGQVGFFASDVFMHEPINSKNTPLVTLDNVIATPHNGGETFENGQRCGSMTARQIIDVLEGREPENRRA